MKAQIVKANLEKNADIEDIWITVQCRKLPSIIIGTVYRHPHALVDSLDYLSEIFKDMCSRNKPFIALGNMNDDLLTPNAKLNTNINRLGLANCIKEPTRITETSASLLDVIITNKVNSIIESSVLPCSVADHELIYAVVNVGKPERHLSLFI